MSVWKRRMPFGRVGSAALRRGYAATRQWLSSRLTRGAMAMAASPAQAQTPAPPAPAYQAGAVMPRRRIDARWPAISGSLLVHGLLLAGVASLTYAVSGGGPPSNRLEGQLGDVAALDDFARLDPTEIAAIDETSIEPSAGSLGAELSPRILESPILLAAASGPSGPSGVPTEGAAGTAPRIEGPALSLNQRFALPSANRLGSSTGIRGTGSEHVGDATEGVDRMAVEILRHLEEGRTLVVWAFDASGSLQAERQRLGAYVGQVYQHIQELDADELAADGALLSAVVAFGQQRTVMVNPTDNAPELARAIESVPRDETGYESSFQTVIDVARKFGRFERQKQPYRTLLVVVSDEVGDDEDRLEAAIAAARDVAMPVYVLGSPAVFGRLEAFLTNYTDPATGEVFERVPVRAGPESVRPESVRLPFWFSGPQYAFLDSGFGPWALSRLARQTGGIYFITRLGPGADLHFSPAGMKEYAPDWDSARDYQVRLASSPLRQAVLAVALATQTDVELPGMPELTFPMAGTEAFASALARNQEQVALIQHFADEGLGPLLAAQADRQREPSRRWQAHYDLTLGRLLAARVRCAEYNFQCARMRRNPPAMTDPAQHNAWRLVPSEKIRSSARLAEQAEQARALLRRVSAEHPGTPWALLAERELSGPLGFEWEETRVEPPRPEPPPANNNNNNNAPQAPERPRTPPRI